MLYSKTTNVLIKLTADDDFIAISTYCRKHGRKGRFLIFKERLQRILEENSGTLYDSDYGNHVTIHNYNDTLHITFDWLSEYSDGTLKGFRQQLEVPVVVFTELMKAGEPMRYLYRVRHAQARIKAIPAAKVIREVQKSRIIRSAFRKALRDSFYCKGDTVTLYRDGGMDFFFRTASGCPAEGGLILHRTTVRTPVGMRPKVYYGVHT
ncbi:MAG: hypothetical protein IJV04_02070 [Lachnospiraceae bacterium]|nr:hypothetical protein [Lachnospiraceae bacterium]